MNKPSDLDIWLTESWPITTIKVSYLITGEDTAETRVDITGSKGTKNFLWSTIEHKLNLGIDYNSIAKPLSYISDSVHAWRKFEKENADDLQELKRLQIKLKLRET